jgi:hypothetical protein
MRTLALTVMLTLGVASSSLASDYDAKRRDDPKKNETAAATLAPQSENDDAVLKPAEPDFTLISLPTSLRLPKYGSEFRVTHRFRGSLRGSFGDNAASLFQIDSGAQIGLEYRFGIIKNGQIGIHRTSDRTIDLFAEYGLTRQGERMPFEIAALYSIEGNNNFKTSYTPSLGVIISRIVGEYAAIYVEPIYVNNSNPLPKELADHNDTFMVGLGARVRVRPTVYLVGEYAPRVAGYRPDVNHAAFAIEKRAGGHMFQLNFSDTYGTTLGQIAARPARGSPTTSKDWYMGFNITRKFF